MTELAFSLLIIGDEILSGKRQDKRLLKVIELLSARCRVSATTRSASPGPRTLERAFASGDIVFSYG
jgi:hypothetical protein